MTSSISGPTLTPAEESLIYRLRKRAEIRRDIKTRKSVQEGKPDRIADLLEEAATEIEVKTAALKKVWDAWCDWDGYKGMNTPTFSPLQQTIFDAEKILRKDFKDL